MVVIWTDEPAYWITGSLGGGACTFTELALLVEQSNVVKAGVRSVEINTHTAGVSCWYFVGVAHNYFPIELDISADPWITIWFYGEGTGGRVRMRVLDRFSSSGVADIVEDWIGWRHLAFNKADFVNTTIPIPVPIRWDILRWIFLLVDTPSAGSRYINLLATTSYLTKPNGRGCCSGWTKHGATRGLNSNHLFLNKKLA